ncbi:hypothetical protein BOX15_Mlig002223g1, partial [Macrostomum lignano]
TAPSESLELSIADISKQIVSMTSVSEGSQQVTQPKFGKNLFKSRIIGSGAQVEATQEALPASGLSPEDYDYNPFYIGNQAAGSEQPPPQPPSPIVCDDFNPFYTPPAASGQAKPAIDKASRRSMINEMLQEMQRLSASPSAPPTSSAGSAELTTAGASFSCGGSGGAGKSRSHEPDFATFSVKVGNDSGGASSVSGVSGTACGSDEPIDYGIGSVSSGGGVGGTACGSDEPIDYGIGSVSVGGGCSVGGDFQDNDAGFATFSVKAGDDAGSRNAVSGTSCGSDEPMSKAVSSAACGGDEPIGSGDVGGGGFGSQASEAAIRVETKLLKFLNDPMVTEFRFEGRMQPADRRAVRWFAKERGLFFKEVALRSHERAYVVRKPYAMAKEQQARHREAQRAEARRLIQEASEQSKKAAEQPSSGSDSATGGGGVSCSGCASFGIKVGGDGDDDGGVGSGGATSATIACSDAWLETEEADGPPGQRGSGASAASRHDNWSQTIPEENFLCYLCQEEVPLVIKAVHIGNCRANQRQQLRQDRADADRELEQLARRQAELRRHKRPGDRRKAAIRQAIEADKERLAGRLTEMEQRHALLHQSAGQQPQKQPQRLAKVRPFESVHANDIQRLLAEARQLDKLCRVQDCGSRLGADCAPCVACGGRFCEQHADGPAHGCSKRANGGRSGGGPEGSSVPTKFERNKLRQGLRDRLAMMAERRK